MEKIVLKQEIVDELKKNPIYFGQMAKHLDIRPISLPRTLSRNSARLTQAGTLRFLSQLFSVEEKDLLEVVPDDKNKNIS